MKKLFQQLRQILARQKQRADDRINVRFLFSQSKTDALRQQMNDRILWNDLQNKHPVVYDVFQQILAASKQTPLCPHLIPTVRDNRKDKVGGSVFYSLCTPPKDYQNPDIGVGLLAPGGQWMGMGWSGFDLSSDARVANGLMLMAQQAGYIDIVEHEGPKGKQRIIKPAQQAVPYRTRNKEQSALTGNIVPFGRPPR